MQQQDDEGVCTTTAAEPPPAEPLLEIDNDLLKRYFADHHHDDLLDFANKVGVPYKRALLRFHLDRDHIVSMEEKCAASATSEEIFNALNSLELKSLDEPIYLFGQFFRKPVECLTLVKTITFKHRKM
ncbi:hypothetical protein Tco_0333059 [Tanacetum coccineum]